MSADGDAAGLAEIAILRVLTAGGPYSENDVLSVAFTNPGIGRLRCHDGRSFEPRPPRGAVPDVVSTVVLCAAGPYAKEQRLTLSFLDPSLARIHPIEAGLQRPALQEIPKLGTATASTPELVPRVAPLSLAAVTTGTARLSVRLRWTNDRVRRFVQVCDKLFTVERLGWYRHSLVLRLLVPDDVRCTDETVRAEAGQQLAMLRAAVGETLGNPLLAAFMPNFSVTPSWLESIETSDIARGLAAFRGVVGPHLAEDAQHSVHDFEGIDETVGTFTRAELLATPFASIEAGLALLLPHASSVPSLAEPLGAYRAKLGDLFGQMADTPEKARLKQMTQSNHVLDDQLWQLVSAVQQTFEPVPAA